MAILSANRRYILHDQLGEGGMGAVYRATDRLRGERVAYKQVLTPEASQRNVQSSGSLRELRTALAREFEVLATLKHPHVINVHDYGFDDNQLPYFTMDILEHPRTIVEAASGKSISEKVKLLMQFLQAMSYLHRRNIIHLDLKPDNVLVQDDENVRVVDFGLATLQSKQHDDQEASGTLKYISPEVLQGEGSSLASDVYAIGLMMYELFLDEHPYGDIDTSQLISTILFGEIDLSGLESIDWQSELEPLKQASAITFDITADLIALMERLITKDPAERLQNASEVIDEFVRATGIHPPEETVEIRESFLQAAQFIGRDQEIDILTQSIIQTLDGKGASWLLSGETGVGKTRMVAELRTIALVRGMLVMRGQAIETGGQPYDVWRRVLQKLVLNVDVSDLEASILKPIVPDIGQLLQRDVADAAPLERQQIKERLIGTIVSLFRRLSRPTIVFLEDLQWASESLDLIERVASLTEETSLMLVGTLNSDMRQDEPPQLANLKTLKLGRLTESNIQELAVSMIGEAGNNPSLLELLQKETEGNTFFLVEVVRSLAETAGQLSKVATMELPVTVFAGGIENIINNRLSHVPDAMRPLLNLAAAMGRELDIAVLEHIVAAYYPTMNLDDWLTSTANLAVLEKQDDGWQFAHDRLRKGCLSLVDATETIQLHTQIAHSIEQVHAENQSEALAYHWGIAGDTEKEKAYSIIAGDRALQSSSYESTIQYLSRATELENDPDMLGQLHYKIGEANRALSNYDAAIEQYQKTQELDSSAKGLSFLGLGRVYLDKGDHETATPFLQQSLDYARASKDRVQESYSLYGQSRAELYKGHLEASNQLAEQAHQIASDINAERAKSLALFALGMGNLRMGKLEEGRVFLNEAQQIDEAIGNRRGVGFSIMYIGVSYILQGELFKGTGFINQTREIAVDIGERRLESIALVNLSAAHFNAGNYAKVVELALRGANIASEIGDQRNRAMSLNNAAQSYIALGDYIGAKQLLKQSVEISEKADFTDGLALAITNMGDVSLATGDLTQAQEYLNRSIAICLENEDYPEVVRRAYGHLAELSLVQSDAEKALEFAEKGLEHQGHDEPWLAPMMKAIALVNLGRKDDAKTYLQEVSKELDEEMSNNAEILILKYVKAHLLLLNALIADPQSMMSQINAVTDAYQSAVDNLPEQGICIAATRRIKMLESADFIGLTHMVLPILEACR